MLILLMLTEAKEIFFFAIGARKSSSVIETHTIFNISQKSENNYYIICYFSTTSSNH
jgi:hypothetical protein